MGQARVLIAGNGRSARAKLRAAVARSRDLEICAEVGDGAAAVQAALQEQPDLCLLDTQMPGGAIAVTREIAARLPEAKIILLAASTTDDDELFHALRAGAKGYLPTRGVGAESLQRSFEGVLRGEAAIPPALVARLVDEFRDYGPRRRALVGENGHDLTSREWEVLDLVRQGLSTRDIAERLFVSRATVRSHVSALRRKLQLPDRDSLRDSG
jgi:DNA-binding NarL/FixJ family response regulator